MASISLGLASLIGGTLAAGGSLASGLLGSNAASTAAQQQGQQFNNALDFQKQMWGTEQANQQPFLDAGKSSIASLMSQIQSGKFGAGSLGSAPTFTGSFHTPTMEEAQATPGYQFTQQQGSKGILQGAAAAGGAISGGTLKALDSFNTGLANTTYNDVFNRSLSTFGTGLQGYQAQLAGFGANMGAQQQEFNQAFAPAALGEGAVQNLNSSGQQTSSTVAQLLQGLGNSQAAGTVGSSNAINSGIGGAVNGIGGALSGYSQSNILQQLLSSLGKSNAPAGTGPG